MFFIWQSFQGDFFMQIYCINSVSDVNAIRVISSVGYFHAMCFYFQTLDYSLANEI